MRTAAKKRQPTAGCSAVFSSGGGIEEQGTSRLLQTLRGFAQLHTVPLRIGLVASGFAVQISFGVIPPADAQLVRVADNPAQVAITEDARDKAGDIFAERCAACHGADGRGDGPAAANLKPKPIDFHSQNWQKSTTDDSISKAIIFGGRSVGKSGQMAPNPDLENEPAIVAALVEKIRKWGR
jgi:mono/diheme cytochrome c family protein